MSSPGREPGVARTSARSRDWTPPTLFNALVFDPGFTGGVFVGP